MLGFRRGSSGMVGPALAVVLALSSMASVPAQAQNQVEQVQSFAAWSGEFQRISIAIVTALQGMPSPPSEEMDRGQKRDWADQARTWAQNAQAATAAARVDLANWPEAPPANAADLLPAATEAIAASRSRLAETANVIDEIASAHLALALTFERDRSGGVREFRTTAIRAALLTMRLFQDINTTSAAALRREHPQRSLLQSFASFYDGLWSLLNFKLAFLQGDENGRAAAADAIGTVAQQMRAHVAGGRAATTSMLAQFNGARAQQGLEPGLLARASSAFATYPASFDREIAIAMELEAIATLLRDPRPMAEVEPSVDAHMETAIRLDSERVADVQARTRLLTQ